jgi:DNA-binding transcriptional MerR regulator
MDKNADAFRTISEVAAALDLPQHVLRFWETRFAQIKPLKRAGGRRFYRPADVEFLRGIKQLLYGEGYTIKGVQRILKEQGVRAVCAAHLPRDAEMEATPFAPREAKPFGTAPDELGELPLFGSPIACDDERADPPGALMRIDAMEDLQRVLRDLEECERILESALRT